MKSDCPIQECFLWNWCFRRANNLWFHVEGLNAEVMGLKLEVRGGELAARPIATPSLLAPFLLRHSELSLPL